MTSRQTFFTEVLPNGLTIIGEPMDAVSSAAISILVPIGAATDPDRAEGAATLLGEMFAKGAGSWSSVELSEAFESLGVHRSHSVGIEASVFSAAMLGDNLVRGLELMSTMLLEPRFPEEELESVRQLALQDLTALDDEPAAKVMVELQRRFYPEPFGRSQLGTKEGLTSVGIGDIRSYYRAAFLPGRSIIGIAGQFDWNAVIDAARRLFGGWQGGAPALHVPPLAAGSSSHHVQTETNQIQIALAYPSVSFADPEFYTARVAVNVLSGGMAGRLFVEVREKRGLVYRVGATHSAARDRAAIFAYAGTAPENAEETLSVIVNELRRLGEGATDEELARAKVDLKSRVVMQSESSSSRAASLVNDWWNLGRLRTVDEVKAAIDGVTNDGIRRHLAAHPVNPVTLVTLGPKAVGLESVREPAENHDGKHDAKNGGAS